MIDFDDVKRAVSVYTASDWLGLEYIERNGQRRSACPACKTKDRRTLAVTPGKGFACWSKTVVVDGRMKPHASGDVVALVAHVRGIPLKDAGEWLAEKAGISSSSKRNSRTVPDREPVPRSEAEEEGTKTLKPLDYLDYEHELTEALGFDPADAEQLGIGYCPKGIMRGTVAVPIRLPDGTLVGYMGLSEAPRLPPSWRFPDTKSEPEGENIVAFPKTA